MINSAPENQSSGRKIFYGLFIFPLLIAVGMAVLLCTVVLLTREVETPESLITAIKTGAPSKRWQKAYELSNELNQGRGLIRESGVMKEVIHILTGRQEYDVQTRSYMAMALSRFEDPEVVPALEKALQEENEPEVELYLLWALGTKGSKSSAEVVKPFLKHEREDLRKVAVYVLGVLGSQEDAALIQPLLDDRSNDVRWNAALSLARLGNDSGYPALLQMVDRQALGAVGGLGEARIEEIMVNAVKGLNYLKKNESLSILKTLAAQDSSLKVRQEAIDALKQYN
ncbi:MAG: HEAT repeat domain-containing protein [Candidatus Omnitrophica bacterium]|nr:HEAT repeat domain-containing protein [Candidatus Omnitrophota bacterium]